MYGHRSKYTYVYGEGAKGDDAASLVRALTMPATMPTFEGHKAAFDFVDSYAGTLEVYSGSGNPVYRPHIQVVSYPFGLSVWIKPYGDQSIPGGNGTRDVSYRYYECENR